MEASQIADLVARAQRREAKAFEQLIDAYSARLYGYFYRLTGARDDAEDLLQEVFVRLVRMIGQYQHDGKFDAWLFRIATNLVRDRVRRNRRARAAGLGKASPNDEADPLGQHADPRMPEPQEVISQAEQAGRLQQAIQRLPEPEREVILLRHFSQISFREIAEVMGTPLGTALARAHRGLIRLRQLMQAEEQ